MGDTPPNRQLSGELTNAPQGSRSTMSQSPGYSENDSRKAPQAPAAPSPQTGYPPMQAYPQQQHGQHVRPENFNMAALGGALPDLSYQGYGHMPPQRYPQGPASPGILYQIQNVQQYTSPPNISPSTATYNLPYQSQYPGVYATGNASPHLQHGTAGSQFYNQGFVSQHQQQGAPYLVQPNQYGGQNQMYAGSPTQYGLRGSFSGDSRLAGQQRATEFLSASTGGSVGRSSSIGSSAGKSSVVRGPPRKPRQSGHAIWIGNLPPQTDLMSLVLHVCKEAPGLESLFLISKSNCAFANFKDEATCAAAQQKIHDSKFQTVRLVSRLRRSSVGTASGVAVPTGPAALSPSMNPGPTRTLTPDGETSPQETAESPTGVVVRDIDGVDGLPKDKFFVVKSLTVEDLELSVRNGIWATQSHNEEALNKAYQTADNVYLIFSANKSGEYFGYAKMISPINDDPAAAIEFAPKAQAVEDPELPKAIPTPATEFSPKGRIIDDSARGTIFWEAEREEGLDEEEDSNKSDQDEDSAPATKAWGKPFKIEWISTTRLPFYRTRGLRNPWNSNREVKIARDGTELETAIGRRLTGLFHRLQEPVAQPITQMHGMPMPLLGFPQVRPFQ
ncbi:Splicing factor [Hyphodiscus hymeniophilus]|uniref:Splicing factor n=1 Tax=Hyphodiscus hymeniophilus TaxID=353542 RepID=A0A9P6VNQ2_9HELO|nr:Splicing factor [Hyphodiscus hymeniophilus]